MVFKMFKTSNCSITVFFIFRVQIIQNQEYDFEIRAFHFLQISSAYANEMQQNFQNW